MEKVIKRHEKGFTDVKTKKGKIVTIPAFTRVKGESEKEGRTYFTVVDDLLNVKEKELSIVGSLSENIGELDIKSDVEINYNRTSNNFIISSNSEEIFRCKAKLEEDPKDPMPNGVYNVFLPDYYHKDYCEDYLSNSDFACVWFRIAAGKGQNYIHVGEVSLGCVSVGPDKEDKDKWTKIYKILMGSRKGAKYVCTIEIMGVRVQSPNNSV